MNKEFIGLVSRKLKFDYPEIIEKDLLIHSVLNMLASNQYFSENFAFKGGTCLVKCYLGYYRFSEDIDFTWVDQSVYTNLSASKRRSKVSIETKSVLDIVHRISFNLGLEFKPNKGDTEYVQLGGNDMRLTLKLHYKSMITDLPAFIKIQINFFEVIRFPIRNDVRALSIVERLLPSYEELKLLFPIETSEAIKGVHIKTYDLQEIAIEKIRAILTRTGIKARDYIDLYIMKDKSGVTIGELKHQAREKIDFAIRWNSLYSSNFEDKKKDLSEGTLFNWGDEFKFMLVPIDNEAFAQFIKSVESFLRQIVV